VERGRKQTPVQVIFFEKKARVRRTVTQTVPEVAGPVDEPREPVTEVDVPVVEDKKARRGKRSKSGTGHPRITVSDEHDVKEAPNLSQLAALGHELFSLGRIEEARAIYEGLVASSPMDGFCHTMLGTICLAQDEHDRALQLFDRAVEIDPTDLAALVYRGELKLNRKKTRQAIEDLEAALRVAPEDDPFTERARRLLKIAKARKEHLKMR